MIDRLFKNWKTTTVGLLMLVASFVLVYLGKTTLTEVGAFMGVGFALLFTKDGK